VKILHVNNSPEGGGTESYINRLIPLLEKNGHQNTVFIQVFTPGDHPITALKNTRLNISRLNAVLASYQPDVIHVHNITNYSLLKRLLKTNICLKSIHEFRPFCTVTRIRADDGEICTHHLSSDCFKHGCFKRTHRSAYRFFTDRKAMNLVPRFSRIWVMSHFMKQMIEPLLTEKTVLDVVPYFYDSVWDEPPQMPVKPRIFSAGRLVRGKGFELLLESLSRMRIPFECKIAGEGPELERLRQMGRKLKLPVEFLGHLPVDELSKWYQWCRIVAFPSDYPEPFGIVGLEAMGAARPVVSFDVGGIRDWLQFGINGFCVPRGDVESFSERLRLLLTDSGLAEEMGTTGWRILKQSFSSVRHVAALEKVYKELSEGPDETGNH
jgi:glycosyltransferase involved in cell wall biosynthesis